jgi:hypothetical protein
MLTSLWQVSNERQELPLEKTEGAIKNGQSRETGNIGHTRHRTKTSKANNTIQKTKNMSNIDPTKNRR